MNWEVFWKTRQIKEQKENEVVELYFVGTEFQLADIFSKPLGREKLEFLMKKVGMQSMSLKTRKKLADETKELWCVLRIFVLYTSSLLNAACKKAVNLLKKGLLIRGGKPWKLLYEEEACLTTKFNNFLKVQVKDLEVHDVSSDEENKAKNTKLKQYYRETSWICTNQFNSVIPELEIQSMLDVPIHQEDLVVQRTPLIDPGYLNVTEKTTSTPTPPTHKLMLKCVSTSLLRKTITRGLESFVWCKEK
ncbi:hypothetical protein Tco_0450647 [Tanacetum coccineum]